MANNDNFEKDVEKIFDETKIQSDDPIIQKCLDIICNPTARVKDSGAGGYYCVYIGDKRYFGIY